MKLSIRAVLALMSQAALAETVQVKFHTPVTLDAFAYAEVNGHSDVSRICSCMEERYMVIRLRLIYNRYCGTSRPRSKTYVALIRGGFFQSRIRDSGSNGPFDYRP